MDDWYYDKSAIMEFWHRISPDCKFFDYDQEIRMRKSVLPAFLETVNLPLSFDSTKYFLNRTRKRRFIDRFLSIR